MCKDCGGYIRFMGILGRSMLAYCMHCGKSHIMHVKQKEEKSKTLLVEAA